MTGSTANNNGRSFPNRYHAMTHVMAYAGCSMSEEWLQGIGSGQVSKQASVAWTQHGQEVSQDLGRRK